MDSRLGHSQARSCSTLLKRSTTIFLAATLLGAFWANSAKAYSPWEWQAIEIRLGSDSPFSQSNISAPDTIYATKQEALGALQALNPSNKSHLLTEETGTNAAFGASEWVQYRYVAPRKDHTTGPWTYSWAYTNNHFGGGAGPGTFSSAEAALDAVLASDLYNECPDGEYEFLFDWVNPNPPSNPEINAVEHQGYRVDYPVPIGCTNRVDTFRIIRNRDVSCPTDYNLVPRHAEPPYCAAHPGIGYIRGRLAECVASEADTRVGNPCDAMTGDKTQTETDYTGAGLKFVRNYHSLHQPSSSGLGVGWMHNYSAHLLEDERFGGLAGLARPHGLYAELRSDGSGGYVSGSGGGIQVVSDAGEWIVHLGDGSQEVYDSTYKLVRLVDQSGTTTTLAYGPDDRLASVTGPYGHSLQFVYTAGRLSSLLDPAGEETTYSYDANDNLVAVHYPDGTSRAYHYEDSSFPNHLTGISDELFNRFATYEYDSIGRAIVSEHAGGAERVELAYNSNNTVVTDSLGATTTYSFSFTTDSQKSRRVNSISRNGDTEFFFNPSNDLQRRVTRYTNARGVATSYSYDAFTSHLTEQIDAADTPLARTTSYQYLGDDNSLPTLVTEPNRTTSYSYDAFGRWLTKSITDLTTTKVRTWVRTYDTQGRILTEDGPRTDVSDVTTYAYYTCTTGYECGQVQTVTNAAGHITTYNGYDANGRLTHMTDPNGLKTALTYDFRGNVSSVIQTPVSGIARTAVMAYDAAGQLQTSSTPDGMVLTYTYTAAQYLASVTDSLGNRIDYDYDAMGNVTDEDAYDPSNTLARALDNVYDLNSRLDTVSNGGFVTDLDFDVVGNLMRETDPKLASTQHSYDVLNRLDQTVDAMTGVIDYGYDDHDNLTSVTSANGVVTNYEYDAFDKLTKEISSDRDITTYTHDEAGNVLTKLDARGMLTSYNYDALGRLSLVTFNGGATIAYEYDTGSNAVGRLNKITDATGTTTWSYDNFGAVTQKVQTIGAIALTTAYSYDAGGRLSTMTMPSGKVLTYGYNIYQRDSVSVDGNTILSGAIYDPFGPVSSWTWGNGSFASRNFDLRGLMSSVTLAGDTRALGYDAAGQLTSALDSSVDDSYDYDLLGRLTSGGPTNAGTAPEPLFTATPVLLASIQTMKNEIGAPPTGPSAPWLTVATKKVTASSAKLALERGQVNTGSIDVKEKIGYVAIEATSGSFVDSGGNTISYEAQTTPEFIQGWGTGCFETAFINTYTSKPVVMAALNTHRGGDGGWLRRCKLNKTVLGLTVDEDKFGDPERRHNKAESAGLVAFSAAFDAQLTDENGSWGMEMAKVTLPSTATTPEFTSVSFRQSFATKPVVIVLPNKSGSNPASVRIRKVTKNGFEVVQVEPAPQNGTHNAMPIHYLAIETGMHTLPDGTKLDVGRKATKKQQHGSGLTDNEAWATVTFGDGTVVSPTQVFDYDANGNRTLLTEFGQSGTYSYLAGSNRLLDSTGPSTKTYSYDLSGNITSDGTYTYGYDDRGRLVDVDSGAVSYVHNGQGQRVSKSNGTQTLFVYDEAGQLIGEYDNTGTAVLEHVWFNGAPVAVLDGTSNHYVHTDQLGTPRVITDGNSVIWRWASDAFGTTAAQEDPDGDSADFTYNLRFPGQYYDDETGVHYNYFRAYDPSTGRYLESDPIGLYGGLNTYAYVDSDPLSAIDPFGNIKWEASVVGGGFGVIGGAAYFYMKFVSQCIDGERAEVDIHALGGGVGVGWKGAAAAISLEFEDFDIAVDPRNLVGPFRMMAAGATVSPVPEMFIGGPGVGASAGWMQVGGAFSTPGLSLTLGLDLSALAVRGRSWIAGEPKFESCSCDSR